MATERKNSIYLVNFENYLKPKVEFKQVQPQPSSTLPPIEQLQEKSSFDMFCESTSIHGLFMLVLTKNAPKWERIGWNIFILSSIIATISMLFKSTIVNFDNPTMTHIESTHYPGYTVPFPAVTLCSLNRMSTIKGHKLAKKFAATTGIPNSEILRLFKVPFYLNKNIPPTTKDLMKFDEVLSHNNYTLLSFLVEITPDCMEEMLRCMWKGRAAPCDSLFEVILTPRGRCCSFNYYARPINRSLRNIQSLTPLIPRHVSGCGYETGLTVLIDPRANDYMAGFIKAPGYRLIVHDAYDFPEDNSDNQFLPIESEVYIAVKSEVTYGTKYLRNMGFKTRGCTFDPEHNLEYFTEYSFWNCLAECLSFRVLNKCGCIAHGMARSQGSEVCNLTQFTCVNDQNEIFQDLVAKTNILGTKICGCMPECSFNKYRTITSTAPLNRTFVKGTHRFFKNVTITDQIILHVFFADLTASLYRTDAKESWQSIVGTVGGITGITMGFSVVSLSEAFFFLCVRPLYLKCVKLVTRVKANICSRL